MSMMDLMIPERSIEPRENYKPLYTCDCCQEAICEGDDVVCVDDWMFHLDCLKSDPIACMNVIANRVDEFVACDEKEGF